MLEAITKHKIRIISLGIVAVLLIVLLLFHNQIANMFVKSQYPTKGTVINLQPPVAATPIPPQPVPTATVKPIAQPVAQSKPAITNQGKKLLDLKGYTIQLMGASSFNKLTAFMLKNHLQTKTYIFHSINKNKDWYTLIYGNYTTRDAATAARQQLPDTLKALKPWIRSMDSVHTAILQSNP